MSALADWAALEVNTMQRLGRYLTIKHNDITCCLGYYHDRMVLLSRLASKNCARQRIESSQEGRGGVHIDRAEARSLLT